jgi:glycosyltransferase involved in cell wall biosynthesis
LPAIGTPDAGSAYDLIEPGVNGFLVQSGNPAELLKAMQIFTDHPERIPAYGAAARLTASRYTAEEGAQQLLGLLDQYSNNQSHN